MFLLFTKTIFLIISNAPPQPIFFPKFQIFFADFPNSTFLPLARDCASWEPAADISTARFVNEWFFLRPHGFQGWMKNDCFHMMPNVIFNIFKECNRNILFSWVKTSVRRTSLIMEEWRFCGRKFYFPISKKPIPQSYWVLEPKTFIHFFFFFTKKKKCITISHSFYNFILN